MFVPLVVTLTLVAQTTSSDAPQFTQDGQLVLPKDYREWVYLSSGLGMTYGPTAQADQGNPMFDNVFVNLRLGTEADALFVDVESDIVDVVIGSS